MGSEFAGHVSGESFSGSRLILFILEKWLEI